MALKNKPRTLKAFIKMLPESFRKNYVISYASRGLEASKGHLTSDEKPRVIFFSPDGELQVAFQEGVEAAEIIRFDSSDVKDPYKFYRHAFEGDPAAGVDKITVRATSCIECHLKDKSVGSRARPNVNPYHMWQTFYGSNDDDAQGEPNRAGMNAYTRSYEDEQSGLAKFYKYREEHPDSVYNLLPDLEKRFPLGSSFKDYSLRPNFQFTVANSSKNSVRIAGELTGHKNYSKYRNLLAWLVSANYCVNEELGPEMTAFRKSASQYRALLSEEILRQARLFLPSGKPSSNSTNEVYEDLRSLPKEKALASMNERSNYELEIYSSLQLLENLTGDPIINKGRKIANWSMVSTKDDIVTFSSLSDAAHGALGSLFTSLYQVDPVLNASAVAKGAYPQCAELQDKAVKELLALGFKETASVESRKTKYVEEGLSAAHVFKESCADCHGTKNKYPIELSTVHETRSRSANSQIGASLEKEILHRLSSEATHPMPKRGSLSPEEIKALRDYLEPAPNR